MKKNQTTEKLFNNLLENRKKQNDIYRRKKKIFLFSFFSFLFVIIISFFLYNFYFKEIKFIQNMNTNYVDSVIYLSNSDFSKKVKENEKMENEAKERKRLKQMNQSYVKHYVIQIGVFKNLANVIHLKKKLEKKDYNTYYEKVESYYRVRLVKNFNARKEAEKYARELKEKKIIDDYWIRLK